MASCNHPEPSNDPHHYPFERSPDRGKGLARDMRVRWALEEVGQPYEVRLLSFTEDNRMTNSIVDQNRPLGPVLVAVRVYIQPPPELPRKVPPDRRIDSSVRP